MEPSFDEALEKDNYVYHRNIPSIKSEPLFKSRDVGSAFTVIESPKKGYLNDNVLDGDVRGSKILGTPSTKIYSHNTDDNIRIGSTPGSKYTRSSPVEFNLFSSSNSVSWGQQLNNPNSLHFPPSSPDEVMGIVSSVLDKQYREDFLLTTDEKTPSLAAYKSTNSADWKFDLQSSTMNLDSVYFSKKPPQNPGNSSGAVDNKEHDTRAQEGVYNIYDTVSSYSDIRQERGAGMDWAADMDRLAEQRFKLQQPADVNKSYPAFSQQGSREGYGAADLSLLGSTRHSSASLPFSRPDGNNPVDTNNPLPNHTGEASYGRGGPLSPERYSAQQNQQHHQDPQWATTLNRNMSALSVNSTQSASQQPQQKRMTQWEHHHQQQSHLQQQNWHQHGPFQGYAQQRSDMHHQHAPQPGRDSQWSSQSSDISYQPKQQTGVEYSGVLRPKVDSDFEPQFGGAGRRSEHFTHRESGGNSRSFHQQSYNGQSRSLFGADPLRTSRESVKGSVGVNAAAASRQELVESPGSKSAYKEFYREFRTREKLSVDDARQYGREALETINDNVRWRVYLELADLAKRNFDLQEARECFAMVCKCQPRATMGFLEWSKMEEENGRIRRALNILILGIKVSRINESLLTRIIKLQERLHNYQEVRGMLSTLKYESVDRIWKCVLEGSLFEARTGNLDVSRKLLKFLMTSVPWYGPIYFEAFRLEEKEERDMAALKIIRRGLEELPRYGPLWFGLMRIMERQDTIAESDAWRRGETPVLVNLTREVAEATRLISKELTWKVFFEKAQAEERAAEMAATGRHLATNLPVKQCRNALLYESRQSLVRSLLVCPANLRWKILLAGSRLELGVGAIDTARKLLRRAFAEVPIKSKANVFLECSRLEEFVGNVDVAREILARARAEVGGEWKIYLESVLLESRAGDTLQAIQAAKEAVDEHPGTGRLWAIYIQLHHRLQHEAFQVSTQTDAAETKESILFNAITQVPKSGEVWCERGRCQLNPLSPETFDLGQAQRSFSFAAQFTPQFGDTFIECVRLEMLCQVLLPQILIALRMPWVSCVSQLVAEDLESDLVDLLMARDRREAWTDRLGASDAEAMSSPGPFFEKQARRQAILAIERMEWDFGNTVDTYLGVVLSSLQRRCVNADPNYGSLWFQCRDQPYDIPTSILRSASAKLAVELHRTERIYGRAILHSVRRFFQSQNCLADLPSASTSTTHQEMPPSNLSSSKIFFTPVKDGKESELRACLATQPVANHSERIRDLCDDMRLASSMLGGTQVVHSEFGPLDFVTGLVELNRTACLQDLDEELRRKHLFGSDQIIS